MRFGKHRKFLAVGLVCTGAWLWTSVPAFAQQVVPNEYVVQLKEGQDASNIKEEEVVPRRKVTITRRFPLVNAVAIRVQPDEGVAVGAGARMFRAEAAESPTIAEVDFNYRYFAVGRPARGAEDGPGAGGGDDPDRSQLWFLERLRAEDAWKISDGSSEIIVAVIDSGVHYKHEDLDGRMWENRKEKDGAAGKDDDGNGIIDDIHGADFFNRVDKPGDPADGNPTGDPTPDLIPAPLSRERPDLPHPTKKEFEAHGTHVAGTIGARAGNGKGIVGIAPDVRIMSLKFLGDFEGSGSLADAVGAIEYALNNGADIINASWGGSGRSTILESAIRKANDRGVLFVAAAGNGDIFGNGLNNDGTPHFPSSYDVPNVLAVAASGKTEGDDLTRFSNFGLRSVDLALPGFEILSTVPTGDRGEPGSGYDSFNGTSMATPIVTGAAVLVRDRFPSMSPEQVIQLLKRTVDRRVPLASKVASEGRLNMLAALNPPLPEELAKAIEKAPVGDPEAVAVGAGAPRADTTRVRLFLRPQPAVRTTDEGDGGGGE